VPLTRNTSGRAADDGHGTGLRHRIGRSFPPVAEGPRKEPAHGFPALFRRQISGIARPQAIDWMSDPQSRLARRGG